LSAQNSRWYRSLSYLPPCLICIATTTEFQLHHEKSLRCLVSNPLSRGSAAMHQPDRILRLKTVLSRTGLSRSTIYRKIAEGTFPAQIRISTNGAGWRESEIDRWIADPVAWRPLNERRLSDGY
jgi:prophage regulatory protein